MRGVREALQLPPSMSWCQDSVREQTWHVLRCFVAVVRHELATATLSSLITVELVQENSAVVFDDAEESYCCL